MNYDNIVFFWQHDRKQYKEYNDRAIFSQWRYSKFKDENKIVYNSAEQYMMYQKAILMGDFEIGEKILNINIYDPKSKTESKVKFGDIALIKKLGRKVKNFDEDLWNKHKFEIVKKGNILKFTQNEDLLEILLSTDDKILIEASPYDKIWGIGLKEEDAYKKDPKDYYKYGENLLGKALMYVRDELKTFKLKN